MKAPAHDRGFTLMEMMVVLFIIAVLSSLAAPDMKRLFSKFKMRGTTTSVTSSLYLARMKAINEGVSFGVEFMEDNSYQVYRDPYGIDEAVGEPNRLDNGLAFVLINFTDRTAVFTPQGQLDKTCLPASTYTGTVIITDGTTDSTRVDVTMLSGRIKETNQ